MCWLNEYRHTDLSIQEVHLDGYRGGRDGCQLGQVGLSNFKDISTNLNRRLQEIHAYESRVRLGGLAYKV